MPQDIGLNAPDREARDDAELYGIGFTVDGERVHPSRVVVYNKIKNVDEHLAALTQRDEALARIAHLEALLRSSANDIGEAATWFRDYECQHLAKGTEDGNSKAETNGLRAEFLETAATRITQEIGNV